MDPGQIRQRAPVLWLFMGLLVVLVWVLAVLQYRWIGEISANEQKQRQVDLQTASNRLGGAFNAEISAATQALQPDEEQIHELGRTKAYESRYSAWRASAQHPRLFRRAGLVYPENGRLTLRMLNTQTGTFETSEWPPDWEN